MNCFLALKLKIDNIVFVFQIRSYFGATNFFGDDLTNANRERLELLERENEGAMFVILSDVHLDDITVCFSFHSLNKRQ